MAGSRRTDGGRVASLDLLRALAISWVFLFHYLHSTNAEWLRPVARFGWAGVDLFFVLSGYLVGRQFGMGARAFYLRRAFRILPAYVAVLALYLAWPGFAEREGMAPAWKFLTFTSNFGLDRANAGAFSHAWSLCVEEHFYLLLPLAALWAKSRRRTTALLLSLFALGFVCRGGLWAYVVEPARVAQLDHLPSIYDQYLYYPTVCRLDGLLAGVALAILSSRRPETWRRLTSWPVGSAASGIALVALGLFLSTDKWSWSGAVLTYPTVSAGFGLLVLSALTPGSILASARIPGARALATLAFSLYLVHKPVIHLVVGALKDQSDAALFGASLTASVAAAAALYFSVERPFLKLRNRFSTATRRSGNTTLRTAETAAR